MKQLYYVNGKRVDINTYANALNAEIAAEEAQNVFEVKKKGFIEYLNKTPSVLSKWENSSFTPESIVQIEFNSWCNSDDCKLLLKSTKSKNQEGMGMYHSNICWNFTICFTCQRSFIK